MFGYYGGGAIAAVRRGYNCLTFEGPGQGEVIREQGLPFRYDWEKVVTPVVDYALSRPEVDPRKVALFGISLGGVPGPPCCRLRAQAGRPYRRRRGLPALVPGILRHRQQLSPVRRDSERVDGFYQG